MNTMNTNTTINTQEATPMTSDQLITHLRKGAPYYEWIGDYGYSTLPKLIVKSQPHRTLEFAVVCECASRTQEGGSADELPEVAGLIADAPVGAFITVPDYHGCHCDGDDVYERTADGWAYRGYFRGEDWE